jgi:hypothetical protein
MQTNLVWWNEISTYVLIYGHPSIFLTDVRPAGQLQDVFSVLMSFADVWPVGHLHDVYNMLMSLAFAM